MKKRIKLSEYQGWPGINYNYKYEGQDMTYTCSIEDWRKYEIIYDLVMNKGVDEKVLDELYSLGYQEGDFDASIGEDF